MEKFFIREGVISEVKVIIFDFDETMYYSPNIRNDHLHFIKKTIMRLGKKSEKQAEKLMRDTGFTAENKKGGSFSSQLSVFGIEKKDWDDYRTKNYYGPAPSETEIVPNFLYKKLSKVFSTYIVSNEIMSNLKEKALKNNIDLTAFKEIYAPKPEEASCYPVKKELYKIIQDREEVKFDEILVVGDRLKVDIVPMLELGGSGVLVKNVQEVSELIEQLLSKNTDKECRVRKVKGMLLKGF